MDVSVSEVVASRHFRMLRDAFRRAAESTVDGVSESAYRFAGRNVRMRVVGRELAGHIALPFSHLRSNAGSSMDRQLDIDLWDESDTGIRCGEAAKNPDSGWSQVTGFSSEGRFVLQKLPHTLIGYDREEARIVGSIAWGHELFVYERAKPLARILLEWHNDWHVQVIHAGLVSCDGQGILFAGRSGSGKSTAALACVCAGFDFLSEDYVGLERSGDGSFLGHSLFSSVFVERSHLAHFPALLPHVVEDRAGRDRKSAVILSRVFPGRMAPVAPIRAVVVTSVTAASEAQYRRISSGQALLSLGPSSLFQIPSRGIRGFDTLCQLVEQVPCFSLELGRDLASIPRRAEEILAEASA